MKTALFVAITLCVSMSALAQKTYVWKGGKPGRANDWSCPANWSTYRVPDEFSEVIIPYCPSKSNLYPVITTGAFEVNKLNIHQGAFVTIQDQGSLLILNPDYCEDVSRIIGEGEVHLSGRPLDRKDVLLVRE